jgi:adenylate cyclase
VLRVSSRGWSRASWFAIERIGGSARLATLVLLLCLLALRALDPTPVKILRFQSFDLYQRLFPREYAALPVRVVDIDEASLASYGQWPWPRTTIAELVDRLAENGAIVTGFDIIFAEEDRLSPDRIAEDNNALPENIRLALSELPSNDSIFAGRIGRARVVLGQTSVRSAADAAKNSDEDSDTPHAAIGGDPAPFLQRFPALVRNLPQLEAAAAGRGVFSLSPDPDGIYRRLPLTMIVGGNVKLALSTEVLRIATGGQAFGIRSNDAGIAGIVVGGQLVATDPHGVVWPYFSESRPQRYISAGAVLDGSAERAHIANHMILVGTSAVGLEDYRATPLGVAMPGVEIHAQVIESILSNSLLWRPNYALGMELVFVFLVGLLVIYIVPKVGAVRALALALVSQAAFLVGSFYAFHQHQMLIDATFPVASTALLFVALATSNYMREERQRQQIRSAFGQYISPDLVEELIADPDRMVLGGETKELTLLFSDVRGFTSLSEEYFDNPQGLTQLMNEFLTELSAPILEHKGTIDKYMGDAVMAFWNAPLDMDNHAAVGCRAALGMLERLAALNEKRRLAHEAEGKIATPINVGIGINTGLCVVGNMGSALRFDYTALGDTVNIASRLEGQSKPFGLPIVIGELTAHAVAAEMATIEIDLIMVKGKKKSQRMHALLGGPELRKDPGFHELAAVNERMIGHYRAMRWDEADAALDAMADIVSPGPGMAGYIELYRARVAELRTDPPPPGWEGVHVAQMK